MLGLRPSAFKPRGVGLSAPTVHGWELLCLRGRCWRGRGCLALSRAALGYRGAVVCVLQWIKLNNSLFLNDSPGTALQLRLAVKWLRPSAGPLGPEALNSLVVRLVGGFCIRPLI